MTDRMYVQGDFVMTKDDEPDTTPDAVFFLQDLYEFIDEVGHASPDLVTDRIRQYLQSIGAW